MVLRKAALSSGVVLISSGRNNGILMYIGLLSADGNPIGPVTVQRMV